MRGLGLSLQQGPTAEAKAVTTLLADGKLGVDAGLPNTRSVFTDVSQIGPDGTLTKVAVPDPSASEAAPATAAATPSPATKSSSTPLATPLLTPSATPSPTPSGLLPSPTGIACLLSPMLRMVW